MVNGVCGQYFEAQDVNTLYRMVEGELQYQPMREIFALPIEEDWCDVEEDLIGDEKVTFESEEITFTKLYEFIRNEFGIYTEPSEFMKAHRKAMTALFELSELWDEDEVMEYPKYLPSFDEFTHDFVKIADN